MKTLTPLQQQRVNQYKMTLKRSSKFYEQDLRDFIVKVINELPEQSKRMLNNINYMNSHQLENFCKKEEDKMLRAGMFNVGNMKPKNALD